VNTLTGNGRALVPFVYRNFASFGRTGSKAERGEEEQETIVPCQGKAPNGFLAKNKGDVSILLEKYIRCVPFVLPL
jgi:hypothetical protein